MKIEVRIIFFTFLLLQGCIVWKKRLIIEGNSESAIKNAIEDFSNTTKFVKSSNVFLVTIENFNDDILRVSIARNVGKFIVIKNINRDNNKIFPTRYVENNDRLFFWQDDENALSQEIIDILNKYNQIDSLEHFGLVELTNEAPKESMQYFFCKNDLTKYKKLKTRKFDSDFILKLDCNR